MRRVRLGVIFAQGGGLRMAERRPNGGRRGSTPQRTRYGCSLDESQTDTSRAPTAEGLPSPGRVLYRFSKEGVEVS